MAAPPSPRWPAALAGAAAVALSLGLTELVAGVVGPVPSLITSVAQAVVPAVPPGVEDAAIATFGTADKAVLVAGTVALTLLVGACAGVAGRRARGSAVVLFVGFSLLGVLAAAQRPGSSTVAVALSTALGAAVGLRALDRLLARTPSPHVRAATDGALPDEPPRRPADPRLSRRRFVVGVAGVAATGAVTAAAGRWLLRGPAGRLPPAALPPATEPLPAVPPSAGFDDVVGLTPVITPNDRFYRIDTALFVPRVDAASWRLRVLGMVDRELELTHRELLALPSREADITLACVSNEVGGSLVGNARWQGVRLADVLERAGVHPGATQIVGRSVDGWTAGFPTELALDGREALIAYGMNGEPLPPRHGYPARLVVPGLYGYVSATKWLVELELTTLEGFDAYWVPRGWAKHGPIDTQSRIDVPRHGADVPADAPVTVAGVAWAPTRGIDHVEVRVDDGPWLPAERSVPLSDDTWVQWRRPVTLAPGPHVLRVRATDGRGRPQVERVTPPRPDGATGLHAVRVQARPGSAG